jgi:lysyl-tRNA synthetase class 2
MTTSQSDVALAPHRPFQASTTIRIIVWSTRLVGLLTVLSVVFPFTRRRLRKPVESWLDLPVSASVAGAAVAVAAGVCLLLLATGLRRRKRRAWQIVVLVTGIISALHLLFHRGDVAGLTAIALFTALLVHRRQFTALPDPAMGKWRAVLVFVQLVVGGVGINLLILLANNKQLVGRPSFVDKLEHAALTLVGVSGPVRFRTEFLDDLTATLGLAAGLAAVLSAATSC